MPRLLFVEDDLSLQASIAYILEREGFTVARAATGRAAIELALTEPPDAILLDVNLPDIDGFAVCQRLRRERATRGVPVILVTARTEVEDIVLGLEQFAEDYVTKPFHPRVLVARVNAVLRRHGVPRGEDAAPLRFADLQVDPTGREVRVAGQRIELTKTEFDLLVLLASRPQRVFTRETILDQLRGVDGGVTERTVDFQIAGLRRKLGVAAHRIETVRGVGYKFAP